MKKVIAIAAAMVLGASVMAMADGTAWTMMITAYNNKTPLGDNQSTLMVGTKTNATDNYDSALEGTATMNNPGAYQTMVYATTNVPGKGTWIRDYRAPKPTQTTVDQKWVWDIHVYTQHGSSSTTVLPYFTVVIKPSTTNVPVYDWNDPAKIGTQHYGYKFTATNGKWYTDAALTNPFTTEWFQQNHQLNTTNGITLYVENAVSAANPFGYDDFNNAATLQLELTPEPGSILALGSGLAGLLGFAIRRKR